jgi:Ca-activated chloride channel family protein
MRVRVRVAADAPPGTQRPPVSVALVVDTSSSMDGEAIARAREASAALLEQLAPGDRVAVVAFGSHADVLVPATTAGPAPRAALVQRLSAMRALGSTDMAGGLSLGLEQLQAALNIPLPEGVSAPGPQRVVLLSDGIPNDPTGIPALGQLAAARGIAVTTLGLGVEYDEILMGALALQTAGRYHYVAQAADVADVFREEVLRLQQVVARNAVVRLSPGPGVQLLGIEGQQPAREGTALRVALGDLVAGEPRDLIVRVALPARHRGATVEVMDARLSFDDAAVGAGALVREGFLAGRASTDARAIADGRDAEVERDALRVRVAAAQIDAIGLARSGDTAQASARLSAAETEARAGAREYNDSYLEREAAAIARLRAIVPALAPHRAEAQTAANSPVPPGTNAPTPTAPVSPGMPPVNPPPATTTPPPQTASVEPQVRAAHDEALRVLQAPSRAR